MNKDWIQAKEAEYTVKAQNYKADIIAKINGSELLTDKGKQILKRVLDEEHGELYGSFETSAMNKIMKKHTKQNDRDFTDFIDVYQFISSLNINAYNNALRLASGGLNRYLDSEPMEFDGDIIITDPCYIMRAPIMERFPLPMMIGPRASMVKTWTLLASIII